ncbi:MAG: periplasmic heavy metal sensor [Candidatus Obscuribacterales bacterium]|nr:periplasmic heavy metal sensor [Candidatus Obscuribacterales bacterium]
MTRLLNLSLIVVAGASFFAVSTSPVSAQEFEAPDLDSIIEMIVEAPESAELGEAALAQLPEPPAIVFAPPQDFVAAPIGFEGDKFGKCPVEGKGCGISAILEGENAITDEQKESFYQLKNQMLDELGPKNLEMSIQKRHLKDMLSQGEIDDKAVKKAIDSISGLKSELSRIGLSYKLKMAKVFTAEQRKALRMAMIKSCGQNNRHSGMMKMMMMRKMMGR